MPCWNLYLLPRFAFRPAFTLVALLALASGASALQLRVYSVARHDRFTGFPSAPVRNAGFLHAALDLSGVGWSAEDTQKQFTLISPRHFAGANHFRPALGSAVRFLAQDGSLVSRTITALDAMPNNAGQPTDVLIGTLDAPIDPASGVSFLPYLNLDSEAAYIGQSLVVLGRSARGGRGTIASIADFGGDPITAGAGINQTRTYTFSYQTAAGLIDDAYAEIGDSGSPALVNVNGRAALVGTHTAVLNALGTINTIDSLVPSYAAKINNHFSPLGYHLTQVTPKPVTLTFSQTPPPLLRAGYPFSLTVPVANTAVIEEAHNLRFRHSWAAIPGASSVTGANWVPDASQPSSLSARRGGLPAGQAAPLSVAGTISDPGTHTSTVRLTADGFAEISQELSLTVIESYRSWSRGLSDAAASSDPDQDGIDNLSEYAFGGDPRTASQTRAGSSLALVPALSRDPASGHRTISWPRRRDAAARALEYKIESSPTLSPGDWTPLTPTSLTSTPIDTDFEQATAELPDPTNPRQFYRIRIILTEG